MDTPHPFPLPKFLRKFITNGEHGLPLQTQSATNLTNRQDHLHWLTPGVPGSDKNENSIGLTLYAGKGGRGCLRVHYHHQLTLGCLTLRVRPTIRSTTRQRLEPLSHLHQHTRAVEHENIIIFEQKCSQAQTIINQNAVWQKNRAKLLGLQYHAINTMQYHGIPCNIMQ